MVIGYPTILPSKPVTNTGARTNIAGPGQIMRGWVTHITMIADGTNVSPMVEPLEGGMRLIAIPTNTKTIICHADRRVKI